MKRLPLLAIGAMMLSRGSFAAHSYARSTPTAARVLADAEAKAGRENKNVLVIFHASWCEWCHRLDDFLAEPAVAPLIRANYVTVHVVVMESAKDKDLENAGGMELLDRFGGKGQGIPFYGILNPKGDVLTVSFNAKGRNIGYPGQHSAIEVFMNMLHKTSNHLTAPEEETIRQGWVEEQKKLGLWQQAQIQDAMAKKDYQAAYNESVEFIATNPALMEAHTFRFEALLYLDPTMALSEFGLPFGKQLNDVKDADLFRAGRVIAMESLSGRAYSLALSVVQSSVQSSPDDWLTDRLLARGYLRLHKLKEALQWEDKAIAGAREEKMPAALIASMMKTRQEMESGSYKF